MSFYFKWLSIGYPQLKNQTRLFSEPEPENRRWKIILVSKRTRHKTYALDIKPVDTQPETEPLSSLLPAHRARHMLLKKKTQGWQFQRWESNVSILVPIWYRLAPQMEVKV